MATGSLVIPFPSPSERVLQDYTLLTSQPEQVAGIKVRGDSMEGTLADGDWVLVDLASREISGRKGCFC
ncbi:S24 family peptidase [Halomonas sp. BC04]|uniref:S24 family peptidase n=1 Tax=Halomonas sp. BC04 TaxID=1403540 RepID=UPI0018CC4814|nr:S24 family peptidase [Halomonas sp. BC04]